MADDSTHPKTSSRREDFVRVSAGICLLLSVVTLIIGLDMALTRRDAPCPNGKFFPEGATDFNCYVHPQGALGTSIVLFSIILATLIVFSSISAIAALHVGPKDRAMGLDQP